MKKKVFASFISVLFSVFLLVGFSESVEAFENLNCPTPINQVFPDPNFADYIAKQLKKQPTDLVTQTELDSITYINIGGSHVKSIEGIKYMHNNQAFHFYDNEVESLEPFRGWENHKLNNLQFYNNHNITDISPLIDTKLPNLWILYMHNLNLNNSAFDALAKFDSSPKMGSLKLPGNHLDDFNKLTKMPHKNAIWRDIEYQKQTIERPAVTVGKDPLVIENTSTDFMDKVNKMAITKVSENGVTDLDNSVTWNAEDIDYGTESLVLNVESVATPDYTNYIKPSVEYTLPLKWQPVFLMGDTLKALVGRPFDPLIYADAWDAEDEDLSGNVTIKEDAVPRNDSNVVTKKGKYKVVYSVTDSDGNEVEQIVQVIVK